MTAWPSWNNTLGGIQETLSRAVSTYLLVWDTKEVNCFCLNILAMNTKLLLLTWTKFLIGLRLQQSMQQRFKLFHCFSDVAAISRNRQALQSQKHSYEASYKLRERWRSVACDLQEQSGNRARFTDLVTFVKKQVKTVSGPLFGNIQEIFRGTTQIKCMIIYYNLRMSVVFLFFRLLDFLFPCRTQRETSADNQDTFRPQTLGH